MDTRRFTMHSLGVHLISSITHLSGDFLHTAWGLLRHPWDVIRNYAYGRRVGLVSPVAMLLLLALYWGILMAVVPYFSQAQQLEQVKLGSLLKWLYGSITFQYLFLIIPITLGTWLVYRKDIAGRFNFAELIIAAIYMACNFLLVNFILIPIDLWNDNFSFALIVIISAVYGIAALVHAFPQQSKTAAVAKLAVWSMISGTLLFVFLVIFSFPFYCDLFF